MTCKKRILHIQLLPLLSGVQRVSLNEISEVMNSYPNDYSYTVACNSEGPLTQELSILGIDYYIISDLKREISLFSDLKATLSLIYYMKKFKFDVVHTHSSKTGFIGRLAARLVGVKKVIHTVHGFSFPMTENKIAKSIFYAMEWLARLWTHSLIVLNETDFDIAVEQLGYKKELVSIIPNGINTSKFSPQHHENQTFRIVMVGRLWKQKNPLCLLQAIQILSTKSMDVQVDFIGDGELLDEMYEFIVNNNLGGKVRLLGWLNEVDKFLPSYNLFVLPSLWEGMPLAILEAQSCGLPAIVSDIPGNNDLVKNGFNGFLFEKNNASDLASKIEMLLSNRALCNKLSSNARAHVCNGFSNVERNNRVLALYNSN